jgi:hypothetical protein
MLLISRISGGALNSFEYEGVTLVHVVEPLLSAEVLADLFVL